MYEYFVQGRLGGRPCYVFEVFFIQGQFRVSATQNLCIPILNKLRHHKCFPNKIIGKTIGLGWREQGIIEAYLQGRHVILQDVTYSLDQSWLDASTLQQ